MPSNRVPSGYDLWKPTSRLLDNRKQGSKIEQCRRKVAYATTQ